MLQTRFERRSGRRALRLLEHPRFRAAYDFLLLRLAASSEHAEDVAFWREAQTQSNEELSATLGVAAPIITESVLSFLGLGFPPDFPTWGRLLFDGLQYMQVYPERVIWPGVAISLTVLSVNYIGDGLRDALDPRIRGR